MYAKSLEKREHILEGARQVFLRKGYAAASMKDIIEECGISRGGLYFYFASVKEIFVAVLQARKRKTGQMLDSLLAGCQSLEVLLREYFAWHKERLLHMDQSLMAATMEYGFAHGQPEDLEFIRELYGQTRATIRQVLDAGAALGARYRDAEALTDHILFTIEGLNTKSMTVGVAEETIDGQFHLLTRMILGNTEEETR